MEIPAKEWGGFLQHLNDIIKARVSHLLLDGLVQICIGLKRGSFTQPDVGEISISFLVKTTYNFAMNIRMSFLEIMSDCVSNVLSHKRFIVIQHSCSLVLMCAGRDFKIRLLL